MNFVNVWIAIPEADHNALNNMRGREESQASDLVMNFVNGQIDPAVVQNLYAQRKQGLNTFHLWSIILVEADGKYNRQINDFRQAYPGAHVLGCWNPDGSQLLNEVGAVAYEQPDFISAFMPDDLNEDDILVPNPTVRDINLLQGQAPREFN